MWQDIVIENSHLSLLPPTNVVNLLFLLFLIRLNDIVQENGVDFVVHGHI